MSKASQRVRDIKNVPTLMDALVQTRERIATLEVRLVDLEAQVVDLEAKNDKCESGHKDHYYYGGDHNAE